MKKLIIFFTAILIMAVSIAAVPSNSNSEKPLRADEVFIPIGNSGNKISLLDLTKISRGDLEKLTGKKMNFVERQAFKIAQKKLDKGIDEDGVITKKKFKKIFGQGSDNGGSGFHLGGFALGFLLGLIGVLLAYVVFKDDFKSSRIKWSWIGFAAALVLGLLIFGLLL